MEPKTAKGEQRVEHEDLASSEKKRRRKSNSNQIPNSYRIAGV